MFLIGSIAILIGLIVVVFSLVCTNQKHNGEYLPSNYQQAANLQISGSANQNPKSWIEANEKTINAISTAFIAAFTVLVATGTMFLWCATIW